MEVRKKCRRQMKSIFAVLLAAVGVWASLSKDVRDNFIWSCQDGGASEAFCSCVFGKVEKKYTQKQIDAIELKMRRGHSDLGYSEFVKKASEECNAKVHSGASLGAVAAEGDLQNSQSAWEGLSAAGLEESFAKEMAGALFSSPEYRVVFLAECAVEFSPYFGKRQSERSCECAYRTLASENGIKKLLETMDGDGNTNYSAALDLFLPCLPKKFTPEMEEFLMDSCQKAAPRKTCQCFVEDIKVHFNLEQFLRRALDDSTFVESYAGKVFDKCKED